MKSKLDPKIKAIRSLPPFAYAADREVRELCAAADIVEVAAGKVICRAQRQATETFLIMDGAVDVVVGGKTIASLQRGEIVGELGVLDGNRRSADVVAASPVTLLVIPAQRMLPLIETNHAMRTAVIRQLADRLRRADEQLAAYAS